MCLKIIKRNDFNLIRLGLKVQIYFIRIQEQMVKTRHQSKIVQDKANRRAMVEAYKQKLFRKTQQINKSMLRQRLKQRLMKQRRQNKCLKPIQLQSIIPAQMFNCSICLQMMIFPVLTQCGHTFCLPCMQESLKHKNMCCLCRQVTTYQHFQPSKLIQDLILNVCFKSMSDQQLDLYQRRAKEFTEKDGKRKIDTNIEVGNFVDFYANRSWSSGTVIQIGKSGKETILKIQHTQKQIKSYEFNLNSRLVARHRYFTRQSYLFPELMGQFRLQISGFNRLPIFEHLIDLQINSYRSQIISESDQYFQFNFGPLI